MNLTKNLATLHIYFYWSFDMTTKVIKIDTGLRLITGALAPYIELDWQDFSLEQLERLLEQVVRFELENNNYARHKEYKDTKGANVEVFRYGHSIKISSLGDVLLVVQDTNFAG